MDKEKLTKLIARTIKKELDKSFTIRCDWIAETIVEEIKDYIKN